MWDLDEYDASRKLKPTSGGSEEKLSKEQAEKLEARLQEHISHIPHPPPQEGS